MRYIKKFWSWKVLITDKKVEVCCGCGACAGICPNGVLVMEEDDKGFYRPQLKPGAECLDCDLCMEVCPGIKSNLLSLMSWDDPLTSTFEKGIGYFKKFFVGYAKDEYIREKGASGGVVTSILLSLLEKKEIDGAIVVRCENVDGHPRARYHIARNASAIIASASSKYIPTEMSDVLRKVIKTKGKYAFVGLPCQVTALRLAQMRLPVLRNRIRYVIGLFCGHRPSNYFVDYFCQRTPPFDRPVTSVQFRDKKSASKSIDFSLVINREQIKKSFPRVEREYSILWDYRFFVEKDCFNCLDVSAKYADVSVGDAWLPQYLSDPKGTSLLVIRNDKMMRYLDDVNLYSSNIADLRVSIGSVLLERINRIEKGGTYGIPLLSKVSFIWFRNSLYRFLSPTALLFFFKPRRTLRTIVRKWLRTIKIKLDF